MNTVKKARTDLGISQDCLLTISPVDRGGDDVVWLIRTQHRRYAKMYYFFVKVDVSLLRPTSTSWLFQMLVKMRDVSLDGPGLHNTNVQRFAGALRRLSNGAGASVLVQMPPQSLTLEHVHAIFESVEEELDIDCSLNIKLEVSGSFRTLFWTFAPLIGVNKRITVSSVGFRTRFNVRRKQKKLLGDFSDSEPPLGATEYLNFSGLKAKLKIRAENALKNVQAAFANEIEVGEKLRSYLNECANLPVDIDFLIGVQNTLNYHAGRKSMEWLIEDMEKYIGAIVICIRASGGYAGKQGIAYSREIHAHLVQKVGWNGAARNLLVSLEFGLMDEICASGFLIQSIGGWNVQAAVELDASNIWTDGQDLIIQGYKGKTDSDTPPIRLGPDDVVEKKAIDLLLWNHRQMIELGYKDPLDGRLLKIVKTLRKDNLPEVQHFVSKLRSKYNLKGFSLGVLRRQKLFIEGLSSHEDARVLAGHASLTTTSIYLDTEVAHRLNSSISLKMKRQLEHELLYAIGLDLRRPTWELMLTPIGDGTSCSDSKNPPPGYEKDDGTCRAIGCHVGDGCPNNRLVIDRDRMREALAIRRMYLNGWKRMHARNPFEFSRLHIPNILFNAALLKLIAMGPYAHILREVENE